MNNNLPQNVTIKGIKNGILVQLNTTEKWLDVTAALAEHIDSKGDFFKGSNITVDLGERPVPKHELTSLKALLERRGLSIWSIMSESQTTIDAAHTLDLKQMLAIPFQRLWNAVFKKIFNPKKKNFPANLLKVHYALGDWLKAGDTPLSSEM